MTNGCGVFRRVLGASLAVAAVLAAPGAAQAAGPADSPFDGAKFTPAGTIDKLVLKALRAKKITPASLCSDAVFFRRAHLDVTGTLPDPREVRDFLADRKPDKRVALIDRLLEREEFADYWAQRWGDLLRIKAEFPINLWPNGVQAYSRWVHAAVRENMPYDRFARVLLTSSGSNFRVPPVNFYRAIQGQEPSAIAAAVGLTFLGARIESWPPARREGMEAFFSRVAYKKTAEWKEEIVYLDPAATEPVRAVFPDGKPVRVPVGTDPREVFADWLIRPDNPWFARNAVNRVWAWLLGRGIVHEPDDFRPDNPPTHPELLDFLAKELVAAKYDLRHVYRLILTSNTYQQSPVPRSDSPQAEAMFACYPVRPLDAEVLVDALNWITGARSGYSSLIPEPYTFIPAYERTIALEDGSITSQFLEMFGRPSRDTGRYAERNRKPDKAQRLHLLNSSTFQDRIARSWRLQGLMRAAGKDHHRLINLVYVTILSRPPTAAERSTVEKQFKPQGKRGRNSNRDAVIDLTWALINTKEFLYRH